MTRLAALAAVLILADLAWASAAFAGVKTEHGGAILFCSFVAIVIVIAVLAHQLSIRRPK